MTQQEAFNVLINAVQVAQKRGAFELEEARTILSAIDTFKSVEKEEKHEKKAK